MTKGGPYRAGCAVGSGIGSLQAMEQEHTKLEEKGLVESCAASGAADDFNMAAGNIRHRLQSQRQEHQCGDSVRHRHKLHRGGVSDDSVRRRGHHGGRRYRELHHAHWHRGLFFLTALSTCEDPHAVPFRLSKGQKRLCHGRGRRDCRAGGA